VLSESAIKILLVDDEPKNLIALEAILTSGDRDLVYASSGEEALRHLLKDDFAVILLDVYMPGMDGFETARLIRGREQSRNTPIIFITAAITDQPFVARGYSIGAADYITKPIDPEVLRSKVAVFVELFRKTQEIRRQADELTETTALLNSVLEGSTEYAIAAMDLDGQVLSWNEGARRVYGYSADEMTGKANIRLLHAPEDVESGKIDALLRAARKGNVESELVRIRKNGQRFSASVFISSRKDAAGETVGFVSISRDITALKRAEQERAQLIEEQAARAAAEEARDRLQQVVDVMPVGIVIADAGGRVQLSNAAAQELIGQVPAAAMLSANDTFEILLAPGTLCPPDELPLVRAVFRGEDVRGEQLLIRRVDDNRTVPVMVNAAPLRDPEGGIVGGVVAFLDISPVKELEQQKDAFVAAVSHDLKNPLTAITASAQLLQFRAAKLEATDSQQFAKGLGAINRAAGRINGMISELTDLAHLRAGRLLELQRNHMDLVELVRQVTAEAQQSSEREIELKTELPSLVGEWDRLRMERVLVNLLSNAIKYSPSDSPIRIDVAREQQNESEWAIVRVCDRGFGIPEDEQTRIFERFYRGSNVQTTIEGTGIGLAGVRQIVEQHDGRISVESQEQQGSTFTVQLPLT
jgi:PAS domain S-box-containing protein